MVESEALVTHDLPGPLSLTSTFPFVGRSAELEGLRTLLPSAEGEGRPVVLLGGEPGSGKSRLVREFAGEAASHGVLVLYGACDAEVRNPYGPFVDALDQLARATEPEELRAAVGAGGGELTRLLPDLGARLGDRPPALEADPDTERHRLHTAVADLLARVTQRRPALLVLEDAHWADAPTLLLLRHLARVGNARVRLITTFRDTEADMPETLSETLADLRRYDVVRLQVPGLTGDDVAEFVRRAGRADPGSEPLELARAIRDLTDGNAFLVCELWRALVETGAIELSGGTIRVTRSPAELGSPESVREVVSQRLSRLAPRTTDLLELAATAGAEFELGVVGGATGLGEPELLAALDEAVRSGMIEEVPSRGLAWRFTHELVRRALYDRLSGIRRAELHLRVGEALEATEARSGRTLADLAHHFAAAAPFGGPERAVEYNVLAARAAVAALAFDEAAARLRTALGLGIDDPQERAEVCLELGNASHRGGKAPDALAAFRAAADIARELENAALLARAAIGYEDACWRPGMHDQGAVELLEEAAAALGEEDSELRVGLLSGLARALDFQGYRERGAIVRRAAVSMARRLGDRAGLAAVLVRSYWSRGTTSVDEILDMLTEARDIADDLGNTEIRVEAMSWRVPAFVALCDLDSARREIPALHEIAEQTAQPFLIHVAQHYGSAIALCDGLDPFRESLWLAALAYLTDASSALGDEAAAALLYPEFEPLTGTNVMIGHLVSCYGAADRYLGMLAATLGESERAEEHFERGMELNRRMGAVTWLAHTEYEYGRFLLAQRRRDDRARADALLREATGLAERIGMAGLLAKIRALGSPAPGAALPDGLSPREVQILGLVAQGLSNRQVGSTLSISEHTAANHVRSILRKTGCANRTEAASYAHRHGLAPTV